MSLGPHHQGTAGTLTLMVGRRFPVPTHPEVVVLVVHLVPGETSKTLCVTRYAHALNCRLSGT